MKRALDYISWVLIAFFAGPTLIAMASWQSLPGSPLYGAKLTLENALMYVTSPSYATQADLNVRYTQRRLTETRVLLASKQSGEGLSYLSHQITATKAVIARAPDPETKIKLAQQYIATLQGVSAELNQQKQAITQTTVSQATEVSGAVPTKQWIIPTETPRTVAHVGAPTATPVAMRPTAKPTVHVPPTATPTPAPQTKPLVVEEIEETEDEIERTIGELEGIAQRAALPDEINNEGGQEQAQETAVPTVQQEHSGNNNREDNNGNNENRGNNQNNGNNHSGEQD